MFMITVTYVHSKEFDSDEEILEDNRVSLMPVQTESEEELLKMINDGILMNIGSVSVELPNITKFEHYCETQEQVDHYLSKAIPLFERLNASSVGISASAVSTEIPSIPWDKTLLSCLSDGKLNWQPV